ncbi:MAG: DNA polymerase zeta [Geoglossum umbratile]|nr:MAG: DNA polymerase zeta [Geoglossum umbratile]
MAQFRMRLNCIDHYQAIPSHFDPQAFQGDGARPEALPKVPVIRVFGATETGQKVCAHIHGAFPYVFIEYRGKLASEEVNVYIHRLHLSIDHALAVSFRRDDSDPKFVARITLVKGVPFYGYHVGHSYFLKVYLFNPRHVTRLADVLQQGFIMKTVFQPYESHLQYLLQWMCDYNLYGCGYINCEKVKFRNPVPDCEEMNSTVHLWHSRSIPPQMISDEDRFQRQSHCSLEVDVCVHDILNRRDLKPRPIHHDFTEAINPLAPDLKLVPSMAGLWEDEARRRRATNPNAYPESSPFPLDALVSMSAEPRSSQKSGWIHEEEYLEKVDALITDETAKTKGQEISFGSFAQKGPVEAISRSVFDSVEDFYPGGLGEQMQSLEWHQTSHGAVAGADRDDTEVDEHKIFSMEEEEYPYDSDEDLAKELDLLSQRINEDQREKPEGGDGTIPSDPYRSPTDRCIKRATMFSNTLGSNDPITPDELAQLGVRDADDFSHIDEDDFDILPECASDITSAMKAAMRSTREPIATSPMKRKKVFHSESSPRSGAGAASIGSTTPLVLPPNWQHPPRLTGVPKPSNASCNRSLPFPVVKDPNDPETIQRLSQRSDATQKSLKSLIDEEISSDSREVGAKTHSSTEFKLSSTASSSMYGTDVPSTLLHMAKNIHSSFGILASARLFLLKQAPPDRASLLPTIEDYGLPQVIYREPYYSNEKDVPDRPREYAGREFKLESDTAPFLPDFDATRTFDPAIEKTKSRIGKAKEGKDFQHRKRVCRLRGWEISEVPPSRGEVIEWLERGSLAVETSEAGVDMERPGRYGLSQIEGSTQKNRYGFKYSQKQEATSVQHETQYMSIMSLEIHVNTRGKLAPNPEEDEISCIFWCLQSEEHGLENNGVNEGTHVGIIALSGGDDLAKKISKQVAVRVEEEPTELDIINRVVDIVRMYDPDILTGYEVHRGSWGYLMERAGYKYDYNLSEELSRTISQSNSRFKLDMTGWGLSHGQVIAVTGRHMLNIWRMVQSELRLLQYTMENVAFHLLHRRIPHYSHRDLTTWYRSGKGRDLGKCIDYYISRVQLDLEILERSELIPRTSEQARILGVDFFSVISRGSQFKVESIMFRLAKPENFILPSPSRKQIGSQNALECLPLVMEPQSAFYTSPVLVLDFQSLYPSIMIAHNYCYSTCLGRVVSWRGQNKMGFTDYKREPGLLELLKSHINVAPNGIMYVRPEIRKSLLAKMLSEILETRVMVKSGMKTDKDDRTLQRLLNNRQLALKLLANVTYGYTSASFSGRMPCAEIADSIVQSGRETLEKAIALIHSVEKWGAEVVYGDTDSIFVHLKGRTKDEAFKIGDEISKAVTKTNLRPIKLKFEKVYFPCVLLAKKRYVGFKYESKDQKEPEFEAKGTETVRRDGTPAEQKIEEKALKILFQTADLSQVKDYFQRECSKIMKGRVSVQDFCFAKEVRLGTYSDKGLPPPGALISTRKMMEDPRAEPQYGERVPYVVVTGAPGARLIDRCVSPETLLGDNHIELDAEYYISKNLIPPLERIFNLVGANVRMWYHEMPKFQRIRRIEGHGLRAGSTKEPVRAKKTLESYMKSSSCIVCNKRLDSGVPLCDDCLRNRETSILSLRARLSRAEKKAANLQNVCRSCAGLAFAEDVRCDSMDCPVFYSRTRQMAELGSTRAVVQPVMKSLEAIGEGWSAW